MGKTYCYTRVSTKNQCEDRQINEIEKYCNGHNIEIEKFFTDKITGKTFNREGLDNLMQVVQKGDTIIIKEMDRLGRNKEGIKAQLAAFKEKGVRVKILNIPTTLIDLPEGQDWVMDMVNNILIEVMGAVAEEERNKILERQKEGMAAMPIDEATGKRKSAKTGRTHGRPKVDSDKLNWAIELYSKKDRTIAEVCKITGVGRSTLMATVKKRREEGTLL